MSKQERKKETKIIQEKYFLINDVFNGIKFL